MSTAVEVTWQLDEITMHGTLTRPDGPGPFPSVVLVAGSGPTDTVPLSRAATTSRAPELAPASASRTTRLRPGTGAVAASRSTPAPSYTGDSRTIAAGAKAEFSGALQNNIESHKFNC